MAGGQVGGGVTVPKPEDACGALTQIKRRIGIPLISAIL